MELDWEEEVNNFHQSKKRVQEFVNSELTTSIPSIFIHPPETLSDPKPSEATLALEIPVIDLSDLYLDEQRPKIVEQVHEAFRTWGFFQAINHGIPMDVMDDTIGAFKTFHEQPKDECVFDQKVLLYSNADTISPKAVNWKDSLRVYIETSPRELANIPRVCKEELISWDEHAKELADKLIELVSEGLGVARSRLKDLSCLESRVLLAHYYPYCPQPDMTMGLPTHTDKGVLNLLFQNEMSGLQIKHDQEWVDVKPTRGGIIVNVADILQMLSNDKYKSVEHRVLANPCKNPRVSCTVIYHPGQKTDTDTYGPLPELLSPESPPLYRDFTMAEVFNQIKNNASIGDSILDFFRHSQMTKQHVTF